MQRQRPHLHLDPFEFLREGEPLERLRMGTGGRGLGGVVGGGWFTRLTVVRCSVAVSVGMGVRATHCAPIRVRIVEALARSGAVDDRERDLVLPWFGWIRNQEL